MYRESEVIELKEKYVDAIVRDIVAFLNANGGNLTNENGSISSASRIGYAANGGTLTLQDIVAESGNVAFQATGEGSKLIFNSGEITAQECGALITTNAAFEMNGGTITAIDNGAVMGNGSAAGSANDGTNMNVVMNGGKLIGHIKSAGYIACAVYVPNSGSFTMNGGEIESDGCGICMRGGQVNIGADAVITANGATGVKGKVGDSRVVVGPYAIVYDANSKYPAMDSLELNIANGAQLSGTDGDIDVILADGVQANINDARA